MLYRVYTLLHLGMAGDINHLSVKTILNRQLGFMCHIFYNCCQDKFAETISVPAVCSLVPRSHAAWEAMLYDEYD